jgi:hypothetical protein
MIKAINNIIFLPYPRQHGRGVRRAAHFLVLLNLNMDHTESLVWLLYLKTRRIFRKWALYYLRNRPGLCIIKMYTAAYKYVTKPQGVQRKNWVQKQEQSLARRIQPKVTLPPMLEENILRRILQPWRHLRKEVSVLNTLQWYPWTKQICAPVDLVIST